MEENKMGIHDPSLLKKAKNSVIEVAQYLLSLDPNRQYFTEEMLGWEAPKPIQGNFRLNKILHMCQIFHCIKYGKPLFREIMSSYKHGAIIHEVCYRFWDLYKNRIPQTNFLEAEKKEFVEKNFRYFKKTDDLTLRDFSHEDPAWELGKEKKELEEEFELMPLNKELINFYREIFVNTWEEIEENND